MKFLKGTRERVSGAIRDIQISRLKRDLENTIRHQVDLMDGHKEADLPPGHPYFQLLWIKVDSAIKVFVATMCRDFSADVSYDDVAVAIPRLKELQDMAQPKAPLKERVAKAVVGGSLLLAIASTAATFVTAFNHNVYTVLTHWVNIHFGS